MSRVDELLSQLERCLRLAAACYDYETATRLRAHADDLREAIRVAREEEAGGGGTDPAL